jgi:GTP-binding protein
MVEIVSSEFVKSAQSIDDSLPSDLSEVVFIGRSNVGKSSLLNSLSKRKGLAKKSSTPGKTQLINFFAITYKNIDKYQLRFVDLPGFGYAKVSKSIKDDWHQNISDFLVKRNSIRVFIHLIDARHFGLDIDMQVNSYLNSIKNADQNIVTVITKMDKLNQSGLSKLKNSIKSSEKFNTDRLEFVSNLKNRGIDKLNQTIFELIFS